MFFRHDAKNESTIRQIHGSREGKVDNRQKDLII
jgi:hypothetical protein